MTAHFFFTTWIEFREQNYPDDNLIYSFIQWLQSLNIKITIDHTIYINVFSYGTVSYLTVSTDDFLNTTNNYTAFNELRIVFEEYFEIKVQ